MPRIATTLTVVAMLAAAGCGSSGGSSSGSSSGGGYGGGAATKTKTSAASGQVVKLSADPSGALKFTTGTLNAKAGTVTLQMSNPSSVPHSIAVEGNGVDKASSQASVGQGQTASVTAPLKAGTYTFYCPVDGHKQAGMLGKLIVK
jgi:plastocyanin